MRNILIKHSILLIIAIIAILFITSTTTATYAQTERDLKDFVGTWKYENPDSCEVFIIKLKIVDDPYWEKLVCGNYSYSKNNVIIENNLQQFDTLGELALFPIYLFPSNTSSNTKHTLSFSDRTYGAYACPYTSFVELIHEKKDIKLRWYMEEGEGAIAYEPDEVIPPDGFSVPSNIIFTKVE